MTDERIEELLGMKIKRVETPIGGQVFATVFLEGLIKKPIEQEPLTLRQQLGRRIQWGLWGSAQPYELHAGRRYAGTPERRP